MPARTPSGQCPSGSTALPDVDGRRDVARRSPERGVQGGDGCLRVARAGSCGRPSSARPEPRARPRRGSRQGDRRRGQGSRARRGDHPSPLRRGRHQRGACGHGVASPTLRRHGALRSARRAGCAGQGPRTCAQPVGERDVADGRHRGGDGDRCRRVSAGRRAARRPRPVSERRLRRSGAAARKVNDNAFSTSCTTAVTRRNAGGALVGWGAVRLNRRESVRPGHRRGTMLSP